MFLLFVLPGLVEHVWDPLSATQTQRLVALITSLQEDYPTVMPANKNTKVAHNLLPFAVTGVDKLLCFYLVCRRS